MTTTIAAAAIGGLPVIAMMTMTMMTTMTMTVDADAGDGPRGRLHPMTINASSLEGWTDVGSANAGIEQGLFDGAPYARP